MTTSEDPLEVVRATLTEVERVHAAAVAAIRTASPAAALAASSALMTGMRRLADADVVLRTEAAGRVWDAERLSLAALAERVGVSKSRAEQMINEVKRARGEKT